MCSMYVLSEKTNPLGKKENSGVMINFFAWINMRRFVLSSQPPHQNE